MALLGLSLTCTELSPSLNQIDPFMHLQARLRVLTFLVSLPLFSKLEAVQPSGPEDVLGARSALPIARCTILGSLLNLSSVPLSYVIEKSLLKQ